MQCNHARWMGPQNEGGQRSRRASLKGGRASDFGVSSAPAVVRPDIRHGATNGVKEGEREGKKQEVAFVFCFATPHSLETFLVLSYVLFGPPRKEEEENERNGRGRTRGRANAHFAFWLLHAMGIPKNFPRGGISMPASMRVHVQCRAKKYSHVSGIV